MDLAIAVDKDEMRVKSKLLNAGEAKKHGYKMRGT
jgi:hypothetical protein